MAGGLSQPFRELSGRSRLDPGWAAALAPVADELAQLDAFLQAERAAGHDYLPAPANVLRAFERPFEQVRVLVVGQDPYPRPGYSIGLAFAVERRVWPLPGSLKNIYRELEDDLGIPPARHGDLSAWADSGVLLLNRVLTVRAGVSDSHRNRGWEAVTECAVDALAKRGGPLVALLWGNKARTLGKRLPGVATIASAHPSPLSAHRGFFGSKPFSRINQMLVEQGSSPIDWRLSE